MEKENHSFTIPMKDNFELLEKRLLEANININSYELKKGLNNINGSTITIGCGGSLVVANYLEKVLSERKIFCICKNSRDIIHGYSNYDSLVACSYSGKTLGIKKVFDSFNGNKYLVTSNNLVDIDDKVKTILTGYNGMDKEKSFVSLSSTLIPIGEFLKYHDKISKEDFALKIKNYINDTKKWLGTVVNQDFLGYGSSEVFEILTGYDTEAVSYFLESTITEAGLGSVIIHDKYSYCHGRSTLCYLDQCAHNLIYLINEKTEIDDFLLDLLNVDYFPVTVIDVSSSNTSSLERQYELLIRAVYLSEKIAKDKNLDLSQVNYNKRLVKKLYNYDGEM